jgi:hypothetical protein
MTPSGARGGGQGHDSAPGLTHGGATVMGSESLLSLRRDKTTRSDGRDGRDGRRRRASGREVFCGSGMGALRSAISGQCPMARGRGRAGSGRKKRCSTVGYAPVMRGQV